MSSMNRTGSYILIAAVIAGFIIGSLLPERWLFRDVDRSEANDREENWACPMLCVVLDHAGTCPVCGMELEPFFNTDGEVILSRHDQQMINLSIEEAAVRDLTTSLKVPGVIEFDETGLHSITAWTGGRLERLHADQQGEHISSGAPLAEIYSPELYAAKQELLILSRNAANSEDYGVILAIEKLRLLGMSDYSINRLIETGHTGTATMVFSPSSGTVVEVLVREGDYVSTGQVLLELADISTVWLTLFLTEDQFGLIDTGQELEFSIDSDPERIFSAVIDMVDPFMNDRGGFVEARITLANASGEFFPGQSAAATILNREHPGTVLSVSRGCVLSLGERSIVYVMTAPTVYREDDDGSPVIEEARFEPRLVRVGPLAADSTGYLFHPVYAGLEEGEVVALKGAFLIDSQAELLGLPSLFNSGTEEH